VNGGGYATTHRLVLRQGESFTVQNRDNCTHELVQTSGPAAAFENLSGTTGTTLQAFTPGVRVTLPTAGDYWFSTVENDAYTYGSSDDLYGGFSRLQSSGPDNVLHLVVHVSPDRHHPSD
jgi:hypothetical protein